jgi:hypothetical protein
MDATLSYNLLCILRDFARGGDALDASLKTVVGDIVGELRVAAEQRNPGMADRVMADGAHALGGIVHQVRGAAGGGVRLSWAGRGEGGGGTKCVGAFFPLGLLLVNLNPVPPLLSPHPPPRHLSVHS